MKENITTTSYSTNPFDTSFYTHRKYMSSYNDAPLPTLPQDVVNVFYHTIHPLPKVIQPVLNMVTVETLVRKCPAQHVVLSLHV